MDDSLTSVERDRLELFATQMILQCLMRQTIGRSLFSRRRTRQLADMFEASIPKYRLGGISGGKEQEARDFMQQRGIQLIVEALPQPPKA